MALIGTPALAQEFSLEESQISMEDVGRVEERNMSTAHLPIVMSKGAART
jgi:hypothetical protein